MFIELTQARSGARVLINILHITKISIAGELTVIQMDNDEFYTEVKEPYGEVKRQIIDTFGDAQ